MSRSLHVIDGFAPEAPALRAHFDERFADPRRAMGERFVWDYWHVPGQYTALRTPAWELFPKRDYEAFHNRLVMWGRRMLGCHDVSPPWLSCYVDGCRQELHGDVPHGPWAFVFSLTPKKRVFQGGETLLVRDDVLDYWQGFESNSIVEERHLLDAVEPKFNRLVVFDPRIPHGVRRVEGTHDVREGRLVVHGWFVEPRPFVEGPLPAKAVEKRIGAFVSELGALLPEGLEPVGLLSVRLAVTTTGTVKSVRVLSDTTRVPRHDELKRADFVRAMTKHLKQLSFSPARAESTITLPLVFER
jgi:hypothetical protein